MRIFCTVICLLVINEISFGQKKSNNTFEIYLYVNLSDKNIEINSNPFEKKTVSEVIHIKKEMPLEDFEYSLEEVFQNKLSKVKRKKWQVNKYDYITLYYLSFGDFEIRCINKSNFDNLNIIKTADIDKIHFNSLLQVLKKANMIFIIIEDSDSQKMSSLKAYQVKLVESQGGL